MFALRGMAVALSVFFLVYAISSAMIAMAWGRLIGRVQNFSPRQRVDLLFLLRIAPLALATLVTAAFTVPSFLLLEPRSIREALGLPPIVLGFCGLLLLLAGLTRCAISWWQAARIVRDWNSSSTSAQGVARETGTVTRLDAASPLFCTVGILRPRVMVSTAVETLLSASELRTAIQHETAHVRRHDNLQKLLLRFVSFPGMRSFDRALFEAMEFAADDAAVSTKLEALDLAAAILKLSQAAPVPVIPELSTGLVHSPAATLSTRIERLLTWQKPAVETKRNSSSWYALCTLAVTVAAFALTYSTLLARIHTATEWLVR